MHFSHLDANGQAAMVDVGEKKITTRTAEARAVVCMQADTLRQIRSMEMKKGVVLSAARFAGICAARKTHELIPLCHNIPIDKVSVDFVFIDESHLQIDTFAKCEYKTGIEMEALTAASVAALTVYDMCKAIDRGMSIENVRLIRKTGGSSGTFEYDGEMK